MVSYILSRVVVLLFGTLYPAYASYKAVKTRNVREYVKWMMYWIVFALFTCVETIGDLFAPVLPLYYEAKIVFIFWLLSPWTKGSSYIYRKLVHPTLSKNEKDIDEYLAQATDKGYQTLKRVSKSGLTIAANAMVTSAIKGQTTILDQIKVFSGGTPILEKEEEREHRKEESETQKDGKDDLYEAESEGDQADNKEATQWQEEKDQLTSSSVRRSNTFHGHSSRQATAATTGTSRSERRRRKERFFSDEDDIYSGSTDGQFREDEGVLYGGGMGGSQIIYVQGKEDEPDTSLVYRRSRGQEHARDGTVDQYSRKFLETSSKTSATAHRRYNTRSTYLY